MFVLFTLKTIYPQQTSYEVYEFNDNDITDDYLFEYGMELAMQHAEMYGLLDAVDEDSGCEPEEPYSMTYEVIDDTREEIIESYGSIIKA